MNTRTERNDKITDHQCLEIYNKILEKKRLYDIPYKLSLRSYGIASWTSFSQRVKKTLDKGK